MNFGTNIFGNRTFDFTGPIQRGNPFEDYLRSADNRSLMGNTKRSQLAHEALMRAEAVKADEDNRLLSTATDAELAFILTRPPQNERQARLRDIIQSDVSARDRGVALMPTWKQKQEYDRGWLQNDAIRSDLQTEQLNRNLLPARFALQIDAEQRQRAATEANIRNQQAARRQAEINAMNQERFRQGQLTNAEKNRFSREAQSGFQNMLNIERNLREQQNDQFRQQQGIYHDAAAAAAAGALPQSDVEAMFGNTLNPTTQSLVQGYAREYARRQGLSDADTNAMLQDMAGGYNSQLEAARQANAPSWFDNINPFYSPTPDEQMANPIIQQALRNKDSRGRITYDPTQQRFVPRLRQNGFAYAPDASMEDYGDESVDGLGENMGDVIGSEFFAAPMQMPASRPAPRAQQRLPEGAVVRNRRTGQMFRVQGGQLVRAR